METRTFTREGRGRCVDPINHLYQIDNHLAEWPDGRRGTELVCLDCGAGVIVYRDDPKYMEEMERCEANVHRVLNREVEYNWRIVDDKFVHRDDETTNS